MRNKIRILIPAIALTFAAVLPLCPLSAQSANDKDDPDARPPVTQADVQIVKRAQEILNSPSQWNRADTRVCPANAKTFSLYCALEQATRDITGQFAHRGAAMQEARFVIDDIAPHARTYQHRLKDYNNDPSTTFADVQTFFRKLHDRVAARLKQQSQSAGK
jgi:hypothetical protein